MIARWLRGTCKSRARERPRTSMRPERSCVPMPLGCGTMATTWVWRANRQGIFRESTTRNPIGPVQCCAFRFMSRGVQLGAPNITSVVTTLLLYVRSYKAVVTRPCPRHEATTDSDLLEKIRLSCASGVGRHERIWVGGDTLATAAETLESFHRPLFTQHEARR
jgi:hypothetical protein